MARLTTAERLGRRGIASVEIDGVLARLTKRQSTDPRAYVGAIDAVSLGVPLWLRVRERMRDEMRPATGAIPPYGRAVVLLSAEYAARAGLRTRWWTSSSAMHAALPRRGYQVTGGMWGGMQVRGSGRDAAIADFGGSSIGRGVVKRKLLRVARGGREIWTWTATPIKVRNSQKAGGIFHHHKIHVLEPTQSEVDACGVALLERIASGWMVSAGGEPVTLRAREAMLADMIRERLGRVGGG